ncbi:MAG: ATP-dependent 6-phosphofructokinase, partial [Oscillospiraceae bacterium]
IQRGGSPSSQDRIVASAMGYHAVELLCKDIGNRVVVLRQSKITDYDIMEALSMKKALDIDMMHITHALSR